MQEQWKHIYRCTQNVLQTACSHHVLTEESVLRCKFSRSTETRAEFNLQHGNWLLIWIWITGKELFKSLREGSIESVWRCFFLNLPKVWSIFLKCWAECTVIGRTGSLIPIYMLVVFYIVIMPFHNDVVIDRHDVICAIWWQLIS